MTKSDQDIMVQAEAITKNFQLYANQTEKLKSTFLGNQSETNFWALRGLSFEVKRGEVIGIVGTNGSGKSTLLNILSGVIPQTSGKLKLNGSIGVVAINEGLNWELTGRENIRIKQLMMGKSNKEITAVMPSIIDFAELGEFIDQPVKDYSNGMRAKLGFSIVTHNNPDILIIDEALSVGDSNFSKKALGKIREFIAENKTIFFVSHDLDQVREFTTKVMWVQYGEMRAFGPTQAVADEYQKFTQDLDKLDEANRDKYVEKQKQGQQIFTLEQLQDRLVQQGKNFDQARNLTAIRSFEGFSAISLYSTLIIIFGLMAIVIYFYLTKGQQP
ncbi:ABC transporter ATP-binding protein [Convivina praedatoris]|uniref:Vitamin B12 import ATP-binding protein BtuD n=1 Tax=Convivina praedatoris TaxID=2880963 RepID=A0ABN8H6Y6_9LACO|nr:ABC transporter ATP-binding protein [Convivina sp. LMG 32447]CAH1850397.1 Vitamin B12 import ATP-binding protein BtuD [Convivina sp. LMG 32447]CAH1850409.1 Vitamin B12 import ATP-binding protein BtuD [Convivina sp. LMG 32447]CAH1850805.1 Vitamin B12 import ATP-binding protein BtuD [Convivina sp. LMG 32447]